MGRTNAKRFGGEPEQMPVTADGEGDSEIQLVDDNNILYGVIMIRTQISLSEQEYEAAKREAEKLGISFAELLRRSLRSMIPSDESKPWMRYAGMVETGDRRASERIDEVVHGDKR